ncbi:MAG: C40 family peptidase [Bacteroidales bacterium]|nr:C40 family peptidase [Bacteroidales bacterium]
MENYGFCHLSSIPVRAGDSHKSEMVSQLLFGETFEIIGESGDFQLIRGTLDKYEGYISKKQHLTLSKAEFENLFSKPPQFPLNAISTMEELNSGNKFFVMTGSSLRGFKNGRLNVGGMEFRFSEPIHEPHFPVNRNDLAETAKLFLHAPYLWAGRSLFGIDCSGLMQVVFNIHGMILQRDAAYQSQTGETLNLLSEAATGDLAFFDDEEGKITHVGMLLHDNKIIHSSGYVRVDNIDHHGIYNQSLKKYTHKLRLVKRVI